MVLRRLRGHFAFFGYDTSHLSDDEFERLVVEGMERVGKVVRQTGITTEEAARALGQFALMGFRIDEEAARG